MPRQEVILSIGNIYHIYNRAVSDNILFPDSDNYHLFLSNIEDHLLQTADILAFCLMPNHYHLLVQLNNTELPTAMKKLALSYVVPFNRSYQRSGHLFQGKYQRKLVDDENYLIHLSRYIHLNPLAASLVKRAEDWKISSLGAYYGISPAGFVKTNVVLDFFVDQFGSSMIEKQFSYKKFVEEWDPDYMSFKEK